jgi:hypothetical protein
MLSGVCGSGGSKISSPSSSIETWTSDFDLEVKKVFLKMRNIQARKFVPCWKLEKLFRAFANDSCTRSSAS